jgi:hypothetical protein
MAGMRKSHSAWFVAYIAAVTLLLGSITGHTVHAACGYDDTCMWPCLATCSCNEDYGQPYLINCFPWDCSETAGYALKKPTVAYGYSEDPPPGFFCPPPSYCWIGYVAVCSEEG